MVDRFRPVLRRFFGFGKVAWYVLIGLAVICYGGPHAVRMLSQDQVVQGQTSIINTCGMKGLWAGSTGPDGKPVHPATPPTNELHPGDLVTWESCVDVAPGSTLSANFELWCQGRPIAASDSHVFSTELRAGWRTFSVPSPPNAPLGECGVRREADVLGPNGAHYKVVASTLNFRMVAP